jgi:hypothetical protein
MGMSCLTTSVCSSPRTPLPSVLSGAGGRYAALRSLLPSTDRTDKATFLTQVVEYVRAVQAGHRFQLPVLSPPARKAGAA